MYGDEIFNTDPPIPASKRSKNPPPRRAMKSSQSESMSADRNPRRIPQLNHRKTTRRLWRLQKGYSKTSNYMGIT